MYKLEQFDDQWAVKDTETNRYFDFASRYEHWWGKYYCFFDDGDCFTDYDTASAKLKELGGGVEEITSQNTEIEEITMSEYKNAGIKSKKELAQRLIDGEVFYWSNIKVYFDDFFDNPFRNGDSSLDIFDYFEHFTTKTEWYEKLDGTKENAVLCWSTITGNLPDTRAFVIASYRPEQEYCYVSIDGGEFTNATPVTKEDLL